MRDAEQDSDTIFNTIGIIVMLPLVNQRASFLVRTMPDKAVSRATPKYLNDAAVELPDAAIEALRQETSNLYDNAFAIIAHGI